MNTSVVRNLPDTTDTNNHRHIQQNAETTLARFGLCENCCRAQPSRWFQVTAAIGAGAYVNGPTLSGSQLKVAARTTNHNHKPEKVQRSIRTAGNQITSWMNTRSDR